ncbi:tyramine receptor tyra-2-like [Gigantopelta aegis]|uniref:tyramine receptor tyra-2-like n=1 Tax=Gigantopelta aegis TaxID=1735272 RepID=UPI001B88D418|nr:tyramine receptor tyra-2-like [Gigantopelta aegis]
MAASPQNMSGLNMSIRTYTGQNLTEIITQLNHRRMLFQIPVMVFLSVIMAMSLFGNSLVVYVYKSKYKKRTSSYFIMVLAVVDLCSALCIPFVVFDLANPYMHSVPIICKINRFIEAWTSAASGLVLMCITFDRYFHVCNPLGIYSINQAQSLTIVMLAMAASVSWPILFLAGKQTVRTPIPGVLGEDCSYRDGMNNSVYTLLFQGGLLFAFFVNFCIFCVFYAKIFYVIYKRRHMTIGEQVSIVQDNKLTKSKLEFKCRLYNKPNKEQDVTTIKNEIPEAKHMSETSHQKTNGIESNHLDEIVNNDEVDSKPLAVLDETDLKPIPVLDGVDSKPISHSTEDYSKPHPVLNGTESKPVPISESQINVDVNKRKCNDTFPVGVQNRSSKAVKRSTMKIRTTRITIILAVVTLATVLGYLPYLTVSLMINFGNHFQHGMPLAEDLVYEFCSKSYFLNGAANPIIYSVMNPVFRLESAAVLKKIASIFHKKTIT